MIDHIEILKEIFDQNSLNSPHDLSGWGGEGAGMRLDKTPAQ